MGSVRVVVVVAVASVQEGAVVAASEVAAVIVDEGVEVAVAGVVEVRLSIHQGVRFETDAQARTSVLTFYVILNPPSSDYNKCEIARCTDGRNLVVFYNATSCCRWHAGRKNCRCRTT